MQIIIISVVVVVLNDHCITRVNEHHGTLIDLTFGSSQYTLTDYTNYAHSNNFSDHKSIFLRLNIAEQLAGDVIRSERFFSDPGIQQFECYLSAQDWRAVAVSNKSILIIPNFDIE